MSEKEFIGWWWVASNQRHGRADTVSVLFNSSTQSSGVGACQWTGSVSVIIRPLTLTGILQSASMIIRLPLSSLLVAPTGVTDNFFQRMHHVFLPRTYRLLFYLPHNLLSSSPSVILDIQELYLHVVQPISHKFDRLLTHIFSSNRPSNRDT